MQVPTNPLEVVIFPSGVQSALPGDTIEIRVNVKNNGNQSAVIELFFDEELKDLTCWESSPRERIGLGSNQNHEVTFNIEIPFEALPGIYNYSLVIDAPQDYPEYTPIAFRRQIKVLLKEQTVIRHNDPTFSVYPPTNPNKPLSIQVGEPLEVEVTVDNRSEQIDRFRLTCPDLNENWYTIKYITNNITLQGTGLVTEANALELNPKSQGQILVEFHPPADTLAGIYSPTLSVSSENAPDLVLLDLVYLKILEVYYLDVELYTTLGQVSRSPGKYEVKLANRGNIIRELGFSAKSLEEDELCIYKFEPSEVRLLPSKGAATNLSVKPTRWWRRPWFGAGLVINFQLEIQDKQEKPLPETLPQGTLVWKARPWWQLILLILLCLGLLGGIGFLIWRLLNPEPLRLESFSSSNAVITEDQDEVRLNWEISRYKQLQNLVVTIQQPARNEPLLNSTLEELTAKEECDILQKEVLRCSNVKTGVTTQGKYVFALKVSYRKGGSFFNRRTEPITKTTEVEIREQPIAEVRNFQAEKARYTNGENIGFSWTIVNPDLLKQLQIVAKAEDGTSGGEPVVYNFSKGIPPQLEKLCERQSQANQQLVCKNVLVPTFKPGKFTFELQASSQNSDKTSFQPTATKIDILPKPYKIVYFKLNGKEAPDSVELQEGEPVTLEWKIEGEKDLNIELSPFGSFKELQGSIERTANLAFPSQIELNVSDKFGQPPEKRGFSIKVIKIEPSPTPTNDPFLPIPLPGNNQPTTNPSPEDNTF
jgi:hypothetical protein